MPDHTQEQTSWGGLIAGFLIGSAIGAGLSVLFAPKSGEETREDLLERLDELKERMDRIAHESAEIARTRISEAREDLKQAMETGRAAASRHASDIRHQVGMD